MVPLPIREDPLYVPSGKLKGKVCLVLGGGGDSGIGAKEGADVVIVYLNEHVDAKATQARIQLDEGVFSCQGI